MKTKKVPIWIRRVIYFTQVFPCADTRNALLNELYSGEFDLKAFKRLSRNCYLAYNESGNQIIHDDHHGAYFNQRDACKAAGKSGTIKNMQRILSEYFNEYQEYEEDSYDDFI